MERTYTGTLYYMSEEDVLIFEESPEIAIIQELIASQEFQTLGTHAQLTINGQLVAEGPIQLHIGDDTNVINACYIGDQSLWRTLMGYVNRPDTTITVTTSKQPLIDRYYVTYSPQLQIRHIQGYYQRGDLYIAPYFHKMYGRTYATVEETLHKARTNVVQQIELWQPYLSQIQRLLAMEPEAVLAESQASDDE